MKGGWVYIMTNGPHGTLYIGVTAELAARVYQHKTGTGSDFCREHGLTRLVYVEDYPTIDEAIVREKRIKEVEPYLEDEPDLQGQPELGRSFRSHPLNPNRHPREGGGLSALLSPAAF